MAPPRRWRSSTNSERMEISIDITCCIQHVEICCGDSDGGASPPRVTSARSISLPMIASGASFAAAWVNWKERSRLVVTQRLRRIDAGRIPGWKVRRDEHDGDHNRCNQEQRGEVPLIVSA